MVEGSRESMQGGRAAVSTAVAPAQQLADAQCSVTKVSRESQPDRRTSTATKVGVFNNAQTQCHFRKGRARCCGYRACAPGSGKSVLMQNIILGIACTNTTAQAKIVLIDPKLSVDYFAFEGLPHMPDGIIDNQEDALLTLNALVIEMNRRYAVLRENKVANIFDLNKKASPTEMLPFLWVIHDEFAEWMLTSEYADAVSDVVARLGVKARAAGISLVFVAERPDANVMPMQLRANLGNRLVLRVDGEGTSEIALGEKGAERLLGKGHLAAKQL